jgi:hypothetical protein
LYRLNQNTFDKSNFGNALLAISKNNKTMPIRYCTLCLLLFFFSLPIYSQKDTIPKKPTYEKLERAYSDDYFCLSAGMYLKKQIVGEIGVTYIMWRGSHLDTYRGWKLATEFNFKKEQFFIAPKFGVETYLALLGLGIKVVDYTNFTYHDVKLTPEIGMAFSKYGTLMYGYNIHINRSRLDYIPKHRLALTINIDTYILFQNMKHWGHFSAT